MYSDSTPSFFLFTPLRFGGFANGIWACCFHASMLALAHTHEPAKDTLLYSLIGVISGFVLVFSASMKAEMCSYQKCVSIFGVYNTRAVFLPPFPSLHLSR